MRDFDNWQVSEYLIFSALLGLKVLTSIFAVGKPFSGAFGVDESVFIASNLFCNALNASQNEAQQGYRV